MHDAFQFFLMWVHKPLQGFPLAGFKVGQNTAPLFAVATRDFAGKSREKGPMNAWLADYT